MLALGYIIRTFKQTFTDVAKELEVVSQTVNDWHKEKKKIPQKRLEQLEELFKLPQSYFLIPENELNEVQRLEIQLSYLQKNNHLIYDSKHPYFKNQFEIDKINKLLEEKKMFLKMEKLFEGGTRIEHEDYNPKGVRNYMLFEKMVEVLSSEMENGKEVNELVSLLLGKEQLEAFETAELFTKLKKTDI
ncbi:hypothetical protein ABEV54_05795 [Peribacillus psychrosaccharolyticus]|uniref:hypothetical protein n=1 Tax=Peribacillus psychrosaccharolyticus TaxID=1407 RepID=UPI003D2D9559